MVRCSSATHLAKDDLASAERAYENARSGSTALALAGQAKVLAARDLAGAAALDEQASQRLPA
jgi:hypothetical protein